MRVMALASFKSAKSVVGLSESPVFHYQYSSISEKGFFSRFEKEVYLPKKSEKGCGRKKGTKLAKREEYKVENWRCQKESRAEKEKANRRNEKDWREEKPPKSASQGWLVGDNFRQKSNYKKCDFNIYQKKNCESQKKSRILTIQDIRRKRRFSHPTSAVVLQNNNANYNAQIYHHSIL